MLQSTCGAAAAARTSVAALVLLWLTARCGAAASNGTRGTQVAPGFTYCAGIDLEYDMPTRGTPPPPLDLHGNRLVNALTGRHVPIRGLNWFGFNVGMGMVDGLWAGGTEAATDFALIAYQIRLLGYNAVRLPFTWRDLDMAPRPLDKACSPATADDLRRRMTSPARAGTAAPAAKPLPGNVSPKRSPRAGYCNAYLPTRSGYHRLLFVTQMLVAQGMYVILDYQPMGLEDHPYNQQAFVEGWARLWKMAACLPNFSQDLANRIFVDVMNEPDSMGIKWEPSGSRPGAHQLYLGTADALWALTPGAVLFWFEGTGQNNFGLNWGNGFITDSGVINAYSLSDPRAFFEELLAKPYVDKVVLTPHVYPPSITRATFLGTSLWDQCRTAFGYLQTEGVCSARAAGGCRVFPVVIGETGSAFEREEDVEWLGDFADFVAAEGGAAAYNSVPVNGWGWWAYNENSGDTGGIVWRGWQDVDWRKVDWMVERLGLKPWYLR